MKTLISTLALTAAVALPAVALAATPLAPTLPQPTVAATTVPVQPVTQARVMPSSAAVAMQSSNNSNRTGYMHQANDDRQGLSRLQDQARQLGATQ